MSNCPKCGGEQNCPCKNCSKRNEGKVVWVWDEDIVSCGHCGFSAHADQWLDWDWEEMKEKLPETE